MTEQFSADADGAIDIVASDVVRIGEPADSPASEIVLPPDPGVAAALGRSHTPQTALADLVDNSVDAGATRIVIEFVHSNEDSVVAVRVTDDGRGMTAADLESALTLGRRRKYGNGPLGHFGVGLKASAFSLGDDLVVVSRTAASDPVAIRLDRDAYTARSVAYPFAPARARLLAADLGASGTRAEIRRPRFASTAASPTDRRVALDELVNTVTQHLGLVFHRILTRRGDELEITVQVVDDWTGGSGAPRRARAIDPFDFASEASSGYPTTLAALLPDGSPLAFVCHVLPPFANGPAAKVNGRPRSDWQGLFLYRNDRLIQQGGWGTLVSASKNLQLARVELDITDQFLPFVHLSPEKHAVTFTSDFARTITSAQNTDTTWTSFLEEARETLSRANRKPTRIHPVTRPGKGLDGVVTSTVREELGFRVHADPVDFEWWPLEPGRLFAVDWEHRTIRLNALYRDLFGTSGGDAQLLKTSLLLMFDEPLSRSWVRHSTELEVEARQRVLAAAFLTDLGSMNGPVREAAANGDAYSIGPVDVVTAYLDAAAPSISGGISALDKGPGHGATSPELEEVPAALGMRDQDNTSGIDSSFEAMDISYDKEIVDRYRSTRRVGIVAADLGLEPRTVAVRLMDLLLPGVASHDDQTLAARHGTHYEPGERERMVREYKSGAAIDRIADRFARTPFAVAWVLLDDPTRPVTLTRQLRKSLSRKYSGP